MDQGQAVETPPLPAGHIVSQEAAQLGQGAVQGLLHGLPPPFPLEPVRPRLHLAQEPGGGVDEEEAAHAQGVHAAAQEELGPGPHLLLQGPPHQVAEEGLYDGGGDAVRCQVTVPDAEEGVGPLPPDVLRRQGEDMAGQLPSGDGVDVLLHRPEVVDGELLLGGQELDDALHAGAVHVLGAQEVGVVVVHDLVVGCGQPVGRRVEGGGQLLEGDEALPFVLVGPARHGDDAMPLGPSRDPAGQLVADVAVHIGIQEVEGRGGPVGEGLPELLPVAGPHQPEERPRQVGRLAGDGTQGQGTLLTRDAGAYHGPVTGHHHLLHHRLGLTPDTELLPQHLGLFPTALVLVAGGVLGVEPLHVEVILVHHGRRDTPGDALVVAYDDAGHARHPHAGHPQARPLQVHLVPEGGEPQH
ncbi:hypothetical protein HRbin25_00844 [bacterium HR25]|nr:hypothetical protein HRbin25_00844 [bacterium HR25]